MSANRPFKQTPAGFNRHFPWPAESNFAVTVGPAQLESGSQSRSDPGRAVFTRAGRPARHCSAGAATGSAR
eukprot:767519-Hanusia_phi.AAC.2